MHEKKHKGLTYTGLIILVVCVAISVLGFVFYDRIYGEGAWCQSSPTSSPLFNKILAFMPKIIGSVQALCVTLLLLYIVCTIISKIFKNTPRRITIGKLINSIVKVVLWVVCVISILAVWGVDLGSLITGAGILTLIVGLGMQSLIADVVAGIFIVCDGTLQVGDIVTIDGWRGTVQEIGIRNTKVINYSGDIRVCNNSTIKTFINQSREDSYPTVSIGVAYGEDLNHIEALFNEHREELRKRLPLLVDGPDYLGVDNFSSSSVELLFGAKCNENDFFAVQRAMRIQLKLFFEEHGVEIPFPKIVVAKDRSERPQE